MPRLFYLLAVCMLSAGASAADDAPIGFSDAAAAAQRALEAQLDDEIEAEQIDAWVKRLSARAHHPGSPYGREIVDYVARAFQAWGFDVDIETFHILLPTPKTREVELLGDPGFRAALMEDVLPEDASTAQRDDLLPPYNAFSIDGEVEGELVFVNYGIPEDYEMLDRHGVDLTGKIAIAKYGKSWRGIKPKLAAEHGAVGTLIYSDPADDGYAIGDAYPDGPYKHATGVQRGSVMDMPTYPGDVQTPGRGATRNARRIRQDRVDVLTKIPVLPISHADALPLLRAMGGAVVPPEWRGALPITYHIGPGPARVRLKAEFNWDRIEIHNVIARMAGSEYPDEWVLRGNRHDAWNHGAADPVSGLAALMAEARAVGAAAAAGNRPKRTVVYAAWDAEEPGLIGSTEWAETHASDLKQHAVAYLNTDGNSKGFLRVGGSHTLEQFFNQIGRSVTDPQTGATLDERIRARVAVAGTQQARADLVKRKSLRLTPLGSGSDYTPFLQHLGIASANLAFSGEGSGGSYHTLYDTYEHYSRFRDPGFEYGAALARVMGRATLRLANAQVLPFRFQPLIDNLQKYTDDVEELAARQRRVAERTNRKLDDEDYRLALDPSKTLGPPPREPRVPHFNFAPLKNAMVELTDAAEAADEAVEAVRFDSDLQALNRQLYTSERRLSDPEGLPGREWYTHQIYAPGFYTGYGVKTLPRVREAIEAEQYDQVDAQIAHTARTLTRFAAYLRELETMATALADPDAGR